MLTINAVQVEVDLTYASTADDVVTRINDAITTQAPGAGTLAVNATGFTLTGNGGNTISIDDGVGGTTAADLGLRGLSSTGGVPAAGDDVGVRLTPLTELTNLGATIDWASGISVTQGGVTQTLDFSAATTVEDLQNVVRNADLGLRLEVNSDGSGLDMVSEVAGIELAVGEAGGTTAADLGLRSYDQDTALNDFRFGLGVNFQEGENDLAITLHDGTSFEVNLDGSTSLGDVTAAIQAAAAAAGLTTAQFDVQFATTGTGLVFTDNTVGASDFQVENANLSLAGSHLGIVQNAGAAATFTSDDRATVRVENSFTHLINLRDALANNDEPGITIAGSNLEDDLDDIINARAVVGVQSKALQDTQTRAEDQKLQEQSMLSNLRDADLAEVISRYQQLQVQLQASLQMTAQSLQLSLMDFLR
jgi:flagellin-like hook-associated protein FlgL